MLFCIYERLRLLCFYACNGLLGAVASCCKAANQVRPNNKSIFSTQINEMVLPTHLSYVIVVFNTSLLVIHL